jgi:hypothetical protein
MKSFNYLTMAFFVVATSCTSFFSDKVRSFIPGTYISHWENEFTTATDTIEIRSPQDAGSETFRITRRTSSMQTIEGRKMQPNYKIAYWNGKYDNDTKTMFIINNGRILNFDAKKQEMNMGSVVYKKL